MLAIAMIFVKMFFMTPKGSIEEKTARLYEDIHPYNDNRVSIANYLDTLGIDESYFRSKDILDCGFGGTGWATELFVRSGAKSVSGVDINPKWRERHLERLSDCNVPLDLRTASVLSLPFKDNSFDYVHSNGVLHHTPDWKKGASEMARVLKPGGTMFLMLYGRFAPVGRVLHGTYRLLGKIVPYSWTAAIVKRVPFLQNPEISILDAMYVPIEDHLTDGEIKQHLENLNLTNIRFFESHKWNGHTLSHPLLFGNKINHNLWANKPL